MIEESYPLSPMQEGMLFHSLYGERLGIYVQQLVCNFSDELDSEAFNCAWQYVLKRHGILRASFRANGGATIQQVHSHVDLPVAQEDWRGLPEEEWRERLQSYLKLDRERGFSIDEAPLMRLGLFRIANGEYKLVWTSHHALMDGRSRLIVLKEFRAVYNAFKRGGRISLEPARSYNNYINWLHQQDWSNAQNFWQERLKGFSSPTQIRLPHSALPPPDEQHETFRLDLPATLTTRVDEFVKQHDLTISTLLQGVWAILLCHYSGENDVVFGVTRSCRHGIDDEATPMVGLIINTVPIRARMRRVPLVSWLRELREQNLSLRPYQHTPLRRIVEWSDVPKGSPLFESILIFENYQLDHALNGTSAAAMRQFQLHERTNYPLTLSVQMGTRLSLKLAYDRAHFEREQVERIVADIERVVEWAIEHGGECVSRAPLVSAEAQTEWEQWNSTALDYPRDRCVHELFEAQVKARPTTVALVSEESELRYSELDELATAVAERLVRLGVGAEQGVGLLMGRRLGMVVGVLGILKSGGAYVPLDASYPAERLRLMTEDAGLSAVVAEAGLELPAELGRVPVVWIEGCSGRCVGVANEGKATAAPRRQVTADNLAYVIYTSGSTGRPKGVQITHRALVNFLVSMAQSLAIKEDDVLLAVTTLSFDIAGLEMYLPLISGARVYVAGAEEVSDPVALRRILDRVDISMMQATPATWDMLLDAGWKPKPSFKLLCGGEAMKPELWERFRQLGCRVWNLYGPTETTIWSTLTELSAANGPNVIGRPIANTQAYVCDPWLRRVGVDVAGELLLGGDGLARGYLGRPELTAERFIPNPFAHDQGERLYRTGDLVRTLPDGRLEYLGRLDQQVKVRGYRIEPGEIEAELQRHEAVRASCVVARGEGSERQLVAYVVTADEQWEQVREELREQLRSRLPAYMSPTRHVRLDALPLTLNGKLDRQALPEPEQEATEEKQVGPRTAAEELIAGIWAEVLRLEQVRVEADFFELGGHSLLATRVMIRIREQLGVEAPLRSIFEHRTVAALARHVESLRLAEQPLTLPPLDTAPREGNLPLSFAQERLWLLDQLQPNTAAYNIPIALRLNGALNQSLLADAVAEIVKRHEILRTAFDVAGDQPVQITSAGQPEKLELVDLSTAAPNAEAAMTSFISAEARRPFDLNTGPLIRAFLLQLSADDFVLLIVMHHAVSDGWSVAILLSELEQLYNAGANEQQAPLSRLPIQYADFAVWQRKWLRGETLENQLAYWKDNLRGAQSRLEFPLSKQRPPIQTFSGATCAFNLSPEVAAQLKRFARAEGCTVFMLLLGLFAEVLRHHTGQTDVLIGTPIANRHHTETEKLIGFFANTLVLRMNLRGNPTVRELVQRARDVSLAAYAHQDVPFEKVVEAVEAERDLSRSPLFQVMLILQNQPLHTPQLQDLETTLVRAETGAAKFDLTLEFVESDGFAGRLQYNSDVFEREQVERIVADIERLVEWAVEHGGECVSRAPLVSAEAQAEWEQWNGTALDYPRDRCVHELFEAQVKERAAAVALVSGESELRYSELDELATAVAERLVRFGIGAEQRVGLLMGRRLGMVVGVLGILKSGGAYVPLDASYPAERLRLMTEDAGLSAVVAEAGLELPEELGRVPVVWVEGCSGRCVGVANEEKATAAPRRQVTADNLAYVIYTSGSTGRPKGVQITHRSAVAFIHWAAKMFSPADLHAVLASTSLSFDLSVFELFVTLNSGGKIVLVDNILELQDRKTACDVTLINTVPSAITELLRSGCVPKTVKTINLAGEALPRTLVQNLYRQTDVRQIWNLYGPSEDTTYSTFEQLARDEDGPVLIGRPIANTQAYVCDPWLRRVGLGVAGELLLGGDGLARGYLGRPELTAERFIPNPFARGEGERLYRTGDLVRSLPDGRLEYLGRLDQQVKVRGYRIEPGEIETELQRHEAVRASCVVARGEGSERQLVAYVVTADEQWEQVREELREQLRTRLPGYMSPTRYVRLDALPLTLNGKLDRHALPEPEQEATEEKQLGPRTAAEELIAGIWAEVLHLEQVGVEADFFELGGHSLLATRVMIRIREQLGVEAPLRSIFEHRTVAALARHVESLRLAQVPAAPTIRALPETELVLSIEQETCLLREWWEGLHDLERRPFHLATALKVSGDLDVAALERALNDLAARHQVLQSSFPTACGILFFKPLNAILKRVLTLRPVQRKLKSYSAKEASTASRRPRIIGGPFLRRRDDRNIDVPVIDLRETPPHERETESVSRMLETAREPFEYARTPLVRMLVLRHGEAEYQVCVVMHHLVSDAWSLNVFLKELAALYDQHAAGKPAQLLELPAQYADYARWQRELLRGETFQNLLAYWRPRLAAIDYFPQAKLPFTVAEPASADFQKRPAQHSLMLTTETASAIRNLSSRSGCTLFICLLAALKALMQRYSGEETIAVLSPFANRLRSETQNMIGWFATGHALISSVSSDLQFSALLAQVKEVVLGASSHQEIPGPFLTRLFMHEIEDDELLKQRFTLPYVFFDFKTRAPQLSLHGLVTEPIELPAISAGPGLGVTVSEQNDSLCLNILYSPEKFETSGVQQMLADYRRVLETVSANPSIRLSEITLS